MKKRLKNPDRQETGPLKRPILLREIRPIKIWRRETREKREKSMSRGLLISFEGNDGAGKSTALQSVAKELEARGIPVLVSREPGGCPISEAIRTLLLDVGSTMDARTEALLYAASRREHLVETIEPALKEGKVILCDRFLDSSLAYQGAGRDLGMETIEELNDFALEGFRPDLTLFFALDPQTEKERMLGRGEMNRLDLESDAFHQRVRDGFEQLLEDNPDRILRVDASKSKEEVSARALEIIEKALKTAGYDR